MSRGRHITYALLRWLFFLASLAYLTHFAYVSFDFRELANGFTAALGIRLSAAALLFATTALLSVVGWRVLLTYLGYARPLAPVAHAFCITQIAKYLPGNVGHHVGRVAIAHTRMSIPTGVSLVSILQESALACLGAFLVSTICLLLLPPGTLSSMEREVWPGSRISFSAVLLAVQCCGVVALAVVNHLKYRRRLLNYRVFRWLSGVAPAWSALRSALPAYAAIYVVNGFALWLIAGSMMDVSAMDLLVLTGAYAISWAIGFLLPGAPGGLGVREAALALLLSGSYTPDIVFSLSVLSRIATVLADLAIFVYGLAASRRG